MKRSFLILFSLFAFASLDAQHIYFSSLNQNLLSLNPSFAGTNEKLRVQVATGRTDWARYFGDQRAYYLGLDFRYKKHHGFGLSVNSQDYRKVYRTVQADLTYAIHFNITEGIKFVPSFQLSYFQCRLDRNYLPVVDEGSRSPFIPQFPDYNVVIYKDNADFSAGLLLYGKRFYVGISILSFTQPDEGVMGVSKRPLTQIYQGKYRFFDPDKFNLDVYAFGKHQPLGSWSTITANFLQYGTYLNWKAISLHLAHRLNDISSYDAFITGVGINFNGFKIGYNNRCNYGTDLSNIFFNELYLQYSFGRNKKDPEEKDNSIKLID